MMYMHLTSERQLKLTATNHDPEVFFAGGNIGWWPINEYRGTNLAILVKAYSLGAHLQSVEEFIINWKITAEDCFQFAHEVKLFLELEDGVWFAMIEKPKRLNGSPPIIGSSTHPFIAICEYFKLVKQKHGHDFFNTLRKK